MLSIVEDEIIIEIVDIEIGKLIIKGWDGQDIYGVNILKSIFKFNVMGIKGYVIIVCKWCCLKCKDIIFLF